MEQNSIMSACGAIVAKEGGVERGEWEAEVGWRSRLDPRHAGVHHYSAGCFEVELTEMEKHVLIKTPTMQPSRPAETKALKSRRMPHLAAAAPR